VSDLLLDDLIDTRKGRRQKVASERVQRQVGERKKEIQDEEASPQTHRPDPDFEVTTSREKEPIVSRMEGYARDEVGVLRGETNVDQLRAFLFFVKREPEEVRLRKQLDSPGKQSSSFPSTYATI